MRKHFVGVVSGWWSLNTVQTCFPSPRDSRDEHVMGSCLLFIQMALQTEKNHFELAMHFISATDTDEDYFGISFW